MNFFKKTRGSVSIFLVIIMVPVIVVCTIFIDVSRIRLAQGLADSSADLANPVMMKSEIIEFMKYRAPVELIGEFDTQNGFVSRLTSVQDKIEMIPHETRIQKEKVEYYEAENELLKEELIIYELLKEYENMKYDGIHYLDDTYMEQIKKYIRSDSDADKGLEETYQELHQVHHYVFYQTYAVEASYELRVPIKYLFRDDYLILDMTAREEVPITDTSEFIRNVDMAVDLTERTKAGEDCFSKIEDLYNKVDEIVNSEDGGGSSEAVAGGVLTEQYQCGENGSVELKPNNTYESNGYQYKTDEQGRIIEVTGTLRLESAKRNQYAQANILMIVYHKNPKEYQTRKGDN